MATFTRQEALDYHRRGRPGKIQIAPTKPLDSQLHLSLAYSPGVAEAVLEIDKDPLAAYEMTARANLVAVISNGSAILGLGDRGPLASKPVMEGKGVLFKKFADVDVFDIEITSQSADEIIDVCKALAPTFGGINLEDIKAPECFEIEQRLIEELDIPVFHDDQHGTAIISGAALLNALEVTGKRMEAVKVVINGAGASAIATGKFFKELGVARENILMLDSRGVIHHQREDNMNIHKTEFAIPTHARTLHDALQGADVLVGLSIAGSVTQEMIMGMAPNPMLFVLANPTPEIMPELALEVRPDAIIGTGRSDYVKSGQQRARLPLHLPRRPGCLRRRHQRRDEDGRRSRPGRAGARRCARQRPAGLRAGVDQIRQRLPDSQTARPARAALGRARRRRSRYAIGGRPPPARPGGIPG